MFLSLSLSLFIYFFKSALAICIVVAVLIGCWYHLNLQYSELFTFSD